MVDYYRYRKSSRKKQHTGYRTRKNIKKGSKLNQSRRLRPTSYYTFKKLKSYRRSKLYHKNKMLFYSKQLQKLRNQSFNKKGYGIWRKLRILENKVEFHKNKYLEFCRLLRKLESATYR